VAAQVNTQPGLPVFSLLTPQLTHTPNQRQVIDTGVIYQTLKLHPYTLIHRRREFLLHNKLRELLPTQNQAQVLFRLCNLTSQQLRELKGGKELEEVETNPAFGYRGALRLLHTHSLLDMELQVVSELAAKHPQRIGIIFPFVRTATELQLLNRHTTQKNWYQLHPLPIWCEIATAAALQEWLEFARVPLAGVVLNFELLTSTMYGIDPDHSDILRLYPSNTELLQSVITQLRSHTPNLQILVQVSDASCRVMECLTQLDVAGVIVR
jgi:phosphoenolpyruvate synthase/pyruvate phosphate dikinase